MYDPRNKKIRQNFALTYLDLNQYEGAVKQYNAIVNLWPEDPGGYFQLSQAYVKNKQYQEALGMLKKAHQMDPKAVTDLMRLGDLIYEAGEYSTAKEVYALSLEADPQLALAHYKMSLVLKGLKEWDKAKQALEQALLLEPANETYKKEFDNWVGQQE